jgi:hypothetical protein
MELVSPRGEEEKDVFTCFSSGQDPFSSVGDIM